MELKFLGRGSAFNVKEGNTSAYYKSSPLYHILFTTAITCSY